MSKRKLIAHLKKIIDYKHKWIECVESRKPLSHLKGEGLHLCKFEEITPEEQDKLRVKSYDYIIK